MTFAVAADSYDRFMGRYSAKLALPFADLAGVATGQRVLDVGCGPGALTGLLVERLGVDAVSAVDPSPPFVAAARERHPGVDVRQATSENLPYQDDTFDVTLAQFVVHFMSDPVAGLREMSRVTKRGGVIAACVWDFADGQGTLSLFWQAARDLNPDVQAESVLAGVSEGEGSLPHLFRAAGLSDVEETTITVSADHRTFEDWWEPFTLGVGPAGAYVAGLDGAARTHLREQCRRLLPAAPFTLQMRAWAARGIA